MSLKDRRPLNKKVLLAIGVIAFFILTDQIVKIWIKTSFTYGESRFLFNESINWAQLHFVENEGMAWGFKFGGAIGKIILSVFRVVAVFFLINLIQKLIKGKATNLLIICVSLVLAGAAGNVIDGIFYGVLFEESTPRTIGGFTSIGNGYAHLLFGRVVDMLYFPFIEHGRWSSIIPGLNKSYVQIPGLISFGQWEQWIPLIGGKTIGFFRPIFNIADSAISIAVVLILLFQKRLLKSYNTSLETYKALSESEEIVYSENE